MQGLVPVPKWGQSSAASGSVRIHRYVNPTFDLLQPTVVTGEAAFR